MLALAALVLVGLAPSAAAADAPKLFPVEDPKFNAPFEGQVPIDYACTVPTTAPDALKVRVLVDRYPVTIAFKGSAAVTCDGTRRKVGIDLVSDGNDPNGPDARPGYLAWAQVSLQGTQLDQQVSIIRTDGDPVPPPVTPSIVVDGDVVFTTPTQGSVTLDVRCNSWTTGVDVTIRGRGKASGDASIACAQEHTVTVPLTAEGTGFGVGTQTVELRAVLADEVSLVTQVDLHRKPPAPVKKPVSLTVDAAPEPVAQGQTITVSGSVRSDGAKVALPTRLEFRADGGNYAPVKAVTSTSGGVLRTTVTATRSGLFRYTYPGNDTTQGGASPGDHIVVTPKLRSLPKPRS